MPRTTSPFRNIRPGRIPFRAVKANRFSCEFRSPTISHAPDRDGLGLIISAETQGGDITDHEAKADIIGDYDFRNRIYSPTLGRWLTKDPLGFDVGYVNIYRYVENGAVSKADPHGLGEIYPGFKGDLPDVNPKKPILPPEIKQQHGLDPVEGDGGWALPMPKVKLKLRGLEEFTSVHTVKADPPWATFYIIPCLHYLNYNLYLFSIFKYNTMMDC